MTRRLRGAAVAAVLTAVFGCGAQTPPGEGVPGLRAHLAHVDTALAGQQYATARSALDALVRETVAAREAGKITAGQAERVLAAAARLAADLPAAEPAPTSTPPIATEPPTTPATRPPTGEPAGQDDEQKEEGKKEEEKKDENGDGHNSDNGPDDGHGN